MADDAASPAATSASSENDRLIAQIEHQIEHLVRSNAELEEHMREHGNDKELRTAVGENIVSIARRRAIIEDLQKGVPTPAAEPVPMDVAPASAGGEPSSGNGVYL